MTHAIIYYDNGGETFDRYTAYRPDHECENTAQQIGLTFSHNADQVNGVSILCYITPGEHLGEQIAPHDLPDALLKHVQERLR